MQKKILVVDDNQDTVQILTAVLKRGGYVVVAARDGVEAVEKETAKHPGLFLAGAAYRGVGLPDCIHQGKETSEKIVRFFS